MASPVPREQEARRQAALAPPTQPFESASRIPPAEARAAGMATILTALVAFLVAVRRRDQRWLLSELARRATPDDVQAVLREEEQRAEAFAEGSARRVATDLAQALALPDRQLREQAVRQIMDRERRFAVMRSEAMAARAIATVGRVSLKRESPQGAFWWLDPTVREHTAGCLIMGGRFWPWVVLDRVHPPRHPGCPCRLRSLGEALASGWMTAADVPQVADAVRMASGVVMEAQTADAILAELELRDRLVESGFVDGRVLASIPLEVV